MATVAQGEIPNFCEVFSTLFIRKRGNYFSQIYLPRKFTYFYFVKTNPPP